MGDLSEHFDELGNFTGTVKLVDNDGTIIEDNIPSFTDPFGLMYPDTGMMPGMREIISSSLSAKRFRKVMASKRFQDWWRVGWDC